MPSNAENSKGKGGLGTYLYANSKADRPVGRVGNIRMAITTSNNTLSQVSPHNSQQRRKPDLISRLYLSTKPFERGCNVEILRF